MFLYAELYLGNTKCVGYGIQYNLDINLNINNLSTAGVKLQRLEKLTSQYLPMENKFTCMYIFSEKFTLFYFA